MDKNYKYNACKISAQDYINCGEVDEGTNQLMDAENNARIVTIALNKVNDGLKEKDFPGQYYLEHYVTHVIGKLQYMHKGYCPPDLLLNMINGYVEIHTAEDRPHLDSAVRMWATCGKFIKQLDLSMRHNGLLICEMSKEELTELVGLALVWLSAFNVNLPELRIRGTWIEEDPFVSPP